VSTTTVWELYEVDAETSAEDSTILSAQMMAGTQEHGPGEGYDWVECGACGAGWQVPHFKIVR
jgi:hypothetical protein